MTEQGSKKIEKPAVFRLRAKPVHRLGLEPRTH